MSKIAHHPLSTSCYDYHTKFSPEATPLASQANNNIPLRTNPAETPIRHHAMGQFVSQSQARHNTSTPKGEHYQRPWQDCYHPVIARCCAGISEPWEKRWKVEKNDRLLDIDGDFGPMRILIKNDKTGGQRSPKGRRPPYGGGLHHMMRAGDDDELNSEMNEDAGRLGRERRKRRRRWEARYPMDEGVRLRHYMEDRVSHLERQVGNLSTFFANQGQYPIDPRVYHQQQQQQRGNPRPERRRDAWSSDSDVEMMRPRPARQPRRHNGGHDEFEGFSDNPSGRYSRRQYVSPDLRSKASCAGGEVHRHTMMQQHRYDDGANAEGPDPMPVAEQHDDDSGNLEGPDPVPVAEQQDQMPFRTQGNGIDLNNRALSLMEGRPRFSILLKENEVEGDRVKSDKEATGLRTF